MNQDQDTTVVVGRAKQKWNISKLLQENKFKGYNLEAKDEDGKLLISPNTGIWEDNPILGDEKTRTKKKQEWIFYFILFLIHPLTLIYSSYLTWIAVFLDLGGTFYDLFPAATKGIRIIILVFPELHLWYRIAIAVHLNAVYRHIHFLFKL